MDDLPGSYDFFIAEVNSSGKGDDPGLKSAISERFNPGVAATPGKRQSSSES